MVQIALALLLIACLVSMALAFHFKRAFAWLICVVPWALLAITGYTASTAPWDLYFFTFWISTGVVIACLLMALQTRGMEREDREADTGSTDDVDNYQEETDQYREKQEKFGKATARRTSSRRK